MEHYTADQIKGEIKVLKEYRDVDNRSKVRCSNTIHTVDGKYTSDTDSDGYSYWYATDGDYRCGNPGYEYFFDADGALKVLNRLVDEQISSFF